MGCAGHWLSSCESLLFPTQDHLPLPRGREVPRHQAVGEGRLDARAVDRHGNRRSLRINAEAARSARVDAAFADGLVTLDLAAAGEREVVLSWE